MSFAFLLLIVFSFVGCTKAATTETKVTTVVIDEVPADIKIPAALWEAIEGKPLIKAGAAKVEKSEGEEKPEAGGEKADVGALFMPVDVILKEKNSGVLKEPEFRIKLPRGGGTVDLSPFIGDVPGSFFVSFIWSEVEEEKFPDTWFVSTARRRKIGDEIWGAPCGQSFLITQKLAAEFKKNRGLKVNTTRNRHLTVLGGHFIFSTKKNGRQMLAQVTLRDPRFEALYCEGM